PGEEVRGTGREQPGKLQVFASLAATQPSLAPASRRRGASAGGLRVLRRGLRFGLRLDPKA
ncbi:hypothetical protein ACFQZU_18350, partial [Streptomonospora algeriensis]